MEEAEEFTITIYSENSVGILNRISAIFVRRHINIESLTTSVSELDDIYKFVIVVKITESLVKKIIGQIEKQIDVLKAYYHTEKEIIHQETALFKMKTDVFFNQREVQNIVRDHSATYIYASRDISVVEKTGRRPEIENLYKALAPYGIMQFVRSGRISVSKTKMDISAILENFKQKTKNNHG